MKEGHMEYFKKMILNILIILFIIISIMLIIIALYNTTALIILFICGILVFTSLLLHIRKKTFKRGYTPLETYAKKSIIFGLIPIIIYPLIFIFGLTGFIICGVFSLSSICSSLFYSFKARFSIKAIIGVVITTIAIILYFITFVYLYSIGFGMY